MAKFYRAFKSNFVAVIAVLMAAVSVIFVPVDREYLAYFDIKTLLCLFSIMLVIGAFKNIFTFTIAARALIRRLKNTRALVLSLVFITYIGSIFIANDMALLTFLPLTILVFKNCGKEKYIAFTVIMQNIAANLGGMIMPFGNPQSLYLYNHFNIPVSEFVKIMAPPFLFSMVLIAAVCLFVKKEPAALETAENLKLNKPRAAIYTVLFGVSLLAVFNVINYLIAAAVIAVALIIADIKSYRKVDYGLLLTFTAFFIFANNMARIGEVKEFVTYFTEKNVLLTGILCSQIISNVPTAVFLSKFTNDYASLLLATNIGGTGTLVASLASLISLKTYSAMYPKKTVGYIIKFSIINFSFLALLTVFCIFTVLR